MGLPCLNYRMVQSSLALAACMASAPLCSVAKSWLHDLSYRTDECCWCGQHLGTEACSEAAAEGLCLGGCCLQGMLQLHSKNIVHRDLKSANLLVDKHWRIKVQYPLTLHAGCCLVMSLPT
jgi:hypothetical protein